LHPLSYTGKERTFKRRGQGSSRCPRRTGAGNLAYQPEPAGPASAPILTAKDSGASAHVREPNSHLPEQDKRFKLSANVWFYAIHIGLLFSLPHRKIVELIRTDSTAGQFDDFIHHRPVRNVVPSQPVRASMGRRINRFREIVNRESVDGQPLLQFHSCPQDFAMRQNSS